jgi:hypothetical protein
VGAGAGASAVMAAPGGAAVSVGAVWVGGCWAKEPGETAKTHKTTRIAVSLMRFPIGFR